MSSKNVNTNKNNIDIKILLERVKKIKKQHKKKPEQLPQPPPQPPVNVTVPTVIIPDYQRFRTQGMNNRPYAVQDTTVGTNDMPPELVSNYDNYQQQRAEMIAQLQNQLQNLQTESQLPPEQTGLPTTLGDMESQLQQTQTESQLPPEQTVLPQAPAPPKGAEEPQVPEEPQAGTSMGAITPELVGAIMRDIETTPELTSFETLSQLGLDPKMSPDGRVRIFNMRTRRHIYADTPMGRQIIAEEISYRMG